MPEHVSLIIWVNCHNVVVIIEIRRIGYYKRLKYLIWLSILNFILCQILIAFIKWTIIFRELQFQLRFWRLLSQRKLLIRAFRLGFKICCQITCTIRFTYLVFSSYLHNYGITILKLEWILDESWNGHLASLLSHNCCIFTITILLEGFIIVIRSPEQNFEANKRTTLVVKWIVPTYDDLGLNLFNFNIFNSFGDTYRPYVA